MAKQSVRREEKSIFLKEKVCPSILFKLLKTQGDRLNYIPIGGLCSPKLYLI